MSEPTLSVTVTNFNYEGYLDQNLDSIRSQTFEDFEVIVVDNASTDASLDVIRRHAAADDRIRLIAHAQNEGMFASMREACDLSRGRFRVQVDADDWVAAPDAFEVQVNMLERHPSMAFVYSSTALTGNNGEVFVTARPYPRDMALRGEEALEAILAFNLTHTGMMMRIDAYRMTDGYTDQYPYLGDLYLGAKLCEVGDVGYIDRSLYAWRQHDKNVSLHPQLHVLQREMLPIIDATVDGPLGSRLQDREGFRRRVVRNALVHLPTQYIFSGRPAAGWRLYWESLKVRPFDTVFQRRTLSLVSRTILGDRVHTWLAGSVSPRGSRK
jgi:glycosyltransferase involved in cell wall biosynthesis